MIVHVARLLTQYDVESNWKGCKLEIRSVHYFMPGKFICRDIYIFFNYVDHLDYIWSKKNSTMFSIWAHKFKKLVPFLSCVWLQVSQYDEISEENLHVIEIGVI